MLVVRPVISLTLLTITLSLTAVLLTLTLKPRTVPLTQIKVTHELERFSKRKFLFPFHEQMLQRGAVTSSGACIFLMAQWQSLIQTPHVRCQSRCQFQSSHSVDGTQCLSACRSLSAEFLPLSAR